MEQESAAGQILALPAGAPECAPHRGGLRIGMEPPFMPAPAFGVIALLQQGGAEIALDVGIARRQERGAAK